MHRTTGLVAGPDHANHADLQPTKGQRGQSPSFPGLASLVPAPNRVRPLRRGVASVLRDVSDTRVLDEPRRNPLTRHSASGWNLGAAPSETSCRRRRPGTGSSRGSGSRCDRWSVAAACRHHLGESQMGRRTREPSATCGVLVRLSRPPRAARGRAHPRRFPFSVGAPLEPRSRDRCRATR